MAPLKGGDANACLRLLSARAPRRTPRPCWHPRDCYPSPAVVPLGSPTAGRLAASPSACPAPSSITTPIKALNDHIERRRAGFTNREHLNRLLMLYAMEMATTTTRFARLDPRAWAATIRDWLDSQRGGRPPRQRASRDRMGPSLRYVPLPPGQGKKSQTP